jgi:peptidoglycan/LPS O-acetylase OafA/YrhL
MTRAATESATSPQRAQARLNFLDGIRGFAALWVVLSHSLKFTGWTIPLLHRGDLAVDVFMMMSGFLMAHHYWLREAKEPWASPQTWATFYLRRFFRIAPLYYLVLAASLLAAPILWEWRAEIGRAFPAAATPAERYLDRSLSNILMHVSFLFGASPRNAFATPLPDWSIGLEMQFYALFPFLMLLLRGASPFWGAVMVCGLGLAISRSLPAGLFAMPSFLPLKISVFMIGVLLAWAHHLQQSRRAGAGSVAVLALLVASSNTAWPVLALAALVAAFLFYDRASDALQLKSSLAFAEHALGGRLAGFLADTSYSVYLTHVLMMVPVAGFLCGLPEFLNLPGPARFLVLSALVIIPVYALSWGLFRLVEMPGITLGKRMVERLVAGTRASEAAAAGRATIQPT